MNIDMNRAFFLRKEDRKPQWIKIDAKGKILGRLATHIADVLHGKNKPFYTPHTDSGDYVVVVNAKDVVLSGKKAETKIYDRYSGWMGGYKTILAGQLMKKNPGLLFELAVRRMLPKGKLGRAIFKKLKVYPEAEHPHHGQIAKTK